MRDGFTILQYTKLFMLEFYYDFIDKSVLFTFLALIYCATRFFFLFLPWNLFDALLLVCLHRYVDIWDFQYMECLHGFVCFLTSGGETGYEKKFLQKLQGLSVSTFN